MQAYWREGFSGIVADLSVSLICPGSPFLPAGRQAWRDQLRDRFDIAEASTCAVRRRVDWAAPQERDANVWHGFVPVLVPARLYGYPRWPI